MHDNERLRHEQVGQVVTEIMRLMQQHRDLELQTLHRTQVEQILDELNLPKDLLDDAVIELRRKEALAKARRRRILLTAAATVVVLALLGTAFWWTAHRRAIIARITAEQGRLTRQTDDGGTLRLIRRDGQEVVYHVTLRNVPLHEQLSLTCNWIDPSGRVFRQNHWQTRLTDKAIWMTSCKCQIGAAVEPGTWQVDMLLGERVLHSTTFQVE